MILFDSTLCGDWRQLYFIYPAFLLIGIKALTIIYEYFNNKFNNLKKRVINIVLILLVAFSSLNILYFMIRYHPYQYVYFNRLAGITMDTVKKNYEMDYWGLTYKDGLEYVLENDSEKTIKIYVDYLAGKYNSHILPESEQTRIEYVENIIDADYYLTNFRWNKGDYNYKEYYSIKVGNAKILVVYKLD